LNEGMPTSSNDDSRGNLYLRFDIIFPTLNDVTRNELVSCLKSNEEELSA